MKNFLIILFILLSSFSFAQSQFQQFVSHVNSITDPTAKTAVVDSFMVVARTAGIPFIENTTANFIYRGNVNTVSVAGDFNGWGSTAWSMTKLASTDFFYRSQTFELDARLDYKLVINGSSWILDPENPKTCAGGFGPNSELAMPEYIQPWEIKYKQNIPHGTVITKNLFSINLTATHQINIYTPPGYDSSSTATYPTVYFQDGTEYISLGYAVNVIDNLIDSGKIQPVIAVFVKPNNRNDEYAFGKRNLYRQFFVNELVPYIDSLFKTKRDPKQRLVLGDSYGGNISALISYNHPDVFGLCGLHSAALQPNSYEVYNMIINGPVKDIKWSSIWGTYEGLFTNMRLFRDYLNSAGYQLDWLERPEGHSWGLWRASIDRMLEYFFPANTTDVNSDENIGLNNFILHQNYPNPFNPSTKIRYTISTSPQSPPYQGGEAKQGWFVILKVYNILGNEVATLVNEEQSPGVYEVEFRPESSIKNPASGVYFYQLKAVSFIQTRKMLLIK